MAVRLFHYLIFTLLFLCVLSVGNAQVNTQQPLTLRAVEALALANKITQPTPLPSKNSLTNEAASTEPKITFGLEKPPVQLPVTMRDQINIVKLGVSQSFSPNDSYQLQTNKSRTAALLAYQLHQESKIALLRTVRHTWLELYYATQAEQLITNQITYLKTLTESQNSKFIQPFILQQTQTQQRIKDLRLELGQLIGNKNFIQPLPSTLPVWPLPPPLISLRTTLIQHPKLRADIAATQLIKTDMALVKTATNPTFEIGASYGMKQETTFGTTPKPDTISAEFNLKLPAASKATQSRPQKSQVDRLEAAQLKQEKDYDQLMTELNKSYLAWQKNKQSSTESALQQQLDRDKFHAQAALNAFHAAKINLSSLVRAYQTVLEVELANLRTAVDNAQTRAELLYFEPNNP